MARKDWSYAHVETSRIGLMVCHSCNKPILEGEFRYRDAGEKYVLAHRKCCSDDQKWGELDRQSDDIRDYNERCYRAAKEFINEFGVMDMEDFIDQYESKSSK